MDIRSLDLTQLIYLGVLLQEKHVTRAAQKLGISQPALSATLARLRGLFRDELLVRTPRGMALTPRAEAIADTLGEILHSLERLVAVDADFDPATSQRTFSLIGSDLIEWLGLPILMARLAEAAPNLQIAYRPSNPKNLETVLASGEIDLAIGFVPDISERLMKATIFTDAFACIARRGHPLIDGGLSLEQFGRVGHVQVLPRDATMYSAPVDEALTAFDIVRVVKLWQPSFLAIPHVVAATDLISTLPRRLAIRFARDLDLQVMGPPIDLPEIPFSIYWHPRNQKEPAHVWLRDFVTSCFRQVY